MPGDGFQACRAGKDGLPLNGFWEQTQLLTAEDVDMGGCWRPSRVLLMMQEAASAQCEPCGLGVNALAERHLAWVLARVQLRMARLPAIGEAVTVRTWPKPAQHLFFPRFFRFSAGGETVGEAAALYLQLDTLTRRMASPWLGGQQQLTCDAEPALAAPGGIPTLSAPAETTVRNALYSDLDLNGHMNNTRYLDWFCDCFGGAHHAQWALREATIHYSREIRAGETATLALQTQGRQSVLRGGCEGVPCFAVYGVWGAR